MGANPYDYWVPYEPDIEAALQKLRQREFAAGRYQVPSDWREDDGPETRPPGPRHASIDEAREAGEADGTQSILDIEHVGVHPDFCVAAPLTPLQLLEMFGSDKPTRQQIENGGDHFDHVERGHCVYVIAHEAGMPKEIYFFGYSFD